MTNDFFVSSLRRVVRKKTGGESASHTWLFCNTDLKEINNHLPMNKITK